MHVKCPRCDGTGKYNGFDCVLCNGKGHEAKEVVNAYEQRQHKPFWNQDRREKLR